MTIRELLNQPELSDIVVLAGFDRLDREISSINIIDSEEIHRWLLGGELVLTNGFFFQDNLPLLCKMLKNLHAVGADGLLIKQNRYISEIPVEAVQLALELAFPLLQAPQELKFGLITRTLAKGANAFADFDKIANAFSSLALEEIDPRAVVDLLSGYSGTDVAFFDLLTDESYLNSGCTRPAATLTPGNIGNLAAEYDTRRIEIAKRCCGTLVIFGAKETLAANARFVIAVRLAVNLLRFYLQLHLSRQSSRKMDGERLLQALLFPKEDMCPEEMECRLPEYGIQPSRPMTIIVIQPDRDQGAVQLTPGFLNCVNTVLREESAPLLWARTGNDMAVLLPCKTLLEAKRFASGWEERIFNRLELHAAMGIGGSTQDVAEIHALYLEAMQAVTLGKKINDGQFVHAYEEMGAQLLLAAAARLPEAEQMIRQTLGPLMEYDATVTDKTLMPTLQMLASCDYHMGKTADRLYIHYNTLKYRYGKICEILDADLNDFKTRVRVFTALSLLHLRD